MFAYFRAPVAWTEIFKRTAGEIVDDNCLGLAAQLAFYFLLALFPALIFMVAVLGYLPIDHAMDALLDTLAAFAPADVLAILRRRVRDVAGGGHAGLLTIGILGALWSSSAAMMAIISTLNRAYDIAETRPWWKQRFIAIGLTLALAVFVVLLQVLLLVGPAAMGVIASWTGLPFLEQIWSVVRWPLVLAVIMMAVDLVYYLAPNADTEWVWLTPGSVVATTLWIAASFGFEWYISNVADFNATYGALGGFIVVMLWFYLSGLAILIGAELNAEIDQASPYRGEVIPSDPQRKPRIGPAAERAHERNGV